MSRQFEIKHSAVPGNSPSTSSLHLGQLAINSWDGKVYFEKFANTTDEILELVSNKFSGSVSMSGSMVLDGALQLQPTSDPDPTGANLTDTFLYVSSSNTALGYDLYYRQDGNVVKHKWLEGRLETGILYGGIVTFSGSYVYVSSGSGIIVNHNANTGSEISPIIDYVAWNSITASITNITSSQVTYIYIDDTGALQQQSVPFTSQQYHQYLPLGGVGHFDYTNISAFGCLVNTAYDQGSQVNSFIDAFGPLKVNGYGITGQTGNWQISVASGDAFIHGGFYPQDSEYPSIYSSPSQATASIVRCYTSGSETIFDTNAGNFYTVIDPTQYDNVGTLSPVGNNNWTVQRVFSYPLDNTLYIYYGQSIYPSFIAALDGLSADPFVEGLSTQPFTVFIGHLVVKSNGNSLTDADSKVVPAGLFRSAGAGGGSGGGGGASALADLTDVSITSPTDGEALIYNAGVWINGAPSADTTSAEAYAWFLS